MPKVSAAEATEKWARRTKAATQDMRAGVERVQNNPAEAAMASMDKMLANFIDAIESGKVRRGLERVTLQQWKDRMINVGVGRVAAGVDNKGAPKMDAFTREFFSHLEQVESELADMPSTTLEDNINRAVHVMRRNAEFRRNR
jgi:hypothetical protein